MKKLKNPFIQKYLEIFTEGQVNEARKYKVSKEKIIIKNDNLGNVVLRTNRKR